MTMGTRVATCINRYIDGWVGDRVNWSRDGWMHGGAATVGGWVGACLDNIPKAETHIHQDEYTVKHASTHVSDRTYPHTCPSTAVSATACVSVS